MHGVIALVCVVCVTGCAIPARDNPHDPSNLAEPSFSVSVDGANSATGSRGSSWVFDAAETTGETGGSCFEWALSREAVDDPSASSTTWDELDDAQPAECQTTISSAENALFANGLRAITDFRRAAASDDPCDETDALIGEETLDGTGVATRWARLRVRTKGGMAETFRLLTVINDPPMVSLGADRRTAPGGRWWLAAPAGPAFTQRIEATVTDPDGPPFDLTWSVTGALKSVIDLDDDDVVDPEFVDGTAVNLPMPLDPARTTLELKAADFVDPDGVITARAGCDSVRADVLTTVWAYSAGTGHLRRLDTSQFLNPFNETDQGVFASDGSRMLIVEEVGASVRPHLMKRGFSLEASSPTSTTNFDLTTVAATWDGNDGWWVQNGENGSLRHYNASMLVDRTFTTVALEGDAVDFDFTAFQAAVVRGPGTDAWVIGGDRIGNTFNTTGQRLFRVKTDGTVVIRMPAHTDAGAVATRLAPDGQGGVWVSADGSPRVPHVASSGIVATPPLDLTGTGCEGGVAELAYDETRNVLWLGVYGAESPLLCRVGPDGSFIPQRVDTLGTLVVDASDGTALMIANDGDGISRYDGASVESIDYIPMNPQFRAKKMVAAGGNLAVWLENKTLVGQNRMAVIEGGEIFVPNNVVLDVDPYLFDEVSHATDPVTGFAWVWHPDDSKIAAYAYGERVFEQYLPGMEEQRVRLALDPDARRLYVAWSSLYTGNGVDPPAIGRLLYMDLTGDFSPMTLNTAAGIEISILRGIGVLPSSSVDAPGRLCLAANLAGEGRGLAYLHPLEPVGFSEVVQPVATLDPGDNTPVHVAVDPMLGHCLFVPSDGSDFMRLDENALPAPSGLAGGTQLSRPSIAPDGRAWSAEAVGDSLRFIDSATQLQFASPTLESAIAGDALSVVADPYYEHVFAGYALGGVTRLIVPPAGIPIEGSRELGTDRPSLDHGR